MLRILPLLLTTLLLYACDGGVVGDVLDGISSAADTYHQVKNGVEAAQTELALAAILGPAGISLLLVVAIVELFLLISFTCCWCCKCCCCSYLKHRPAHPNQVTVRQPQQIIGMMPTGSVYPASATSYNPNEYAQDNPPAYANYKMDAPLLDNME
ncbi:hypothetical protein ACHWQZ_G017989 [Mnemiopsis leidyi]